MLRRLPVVFVLLACLAAALRAATPLDVAISLYDQKRYPEADIVLRRIVATESGNAAACHYLALTIGKRNDPAALDEAMPWIEKATALAPDDPAILADYGSFCLMTASRHRSLGYARKGRAALERCVELNPGDLDARDGLMHFYQESPWPFGSSAKARDQAEAIARLDPARGFRAFIYLKRADKDYDGIFTLCDAALRDHPDDYLALFEYGRAASLSGENVPRALGRLLHCLTLTPPPSAPGPTAIYYRLGLLYEKQGDTDSARDALTKAVELDASNRPAADALARLK